MKFNVLKKPAGAEDNGYIILRPLSGEDVAAVNKFSDGDVLEVTVKRDRDYRLTKKYWALCSLAADNYKMEGYRFLTHKNLVDEFIKLRLGLIESQLVFPDGRVHVRTGSIAHNAMDNDDFAKFLADAEKIIEEITGLTGAELSENYHEYGA